MLPSGEYAVNIVTRFATVNVNKVDICVRNRINSTCISVVPFDVHFHYP